MTTSKPQYIYRVSHYPGEANMAQVSVAIYDPERYEGEGGERFGYDATVYVDSVIWEGRDQPPAQPSQGSIGSVAPEDALLRIDVYRQATAIAFWINDQLLSESKTLDETMTALKLQLDAEPVHDAPPLVCSYRVGSSMS